MTPFGRKKFATVGLLLLESVAWGATPGWTRISSRQMPLTLVTTGPVARAGEALGEIERMRRTVVGQWPEFQGTRELTVVAFGGEAEYSAYRPNGYSPAYYLSGTGQNIIVLNQLGRESWPALRHEYAHHLMKQAGWKLPLWLDEGLADVLGGVEERRARTRAENLRRLGLVGLRELTAATKETDWYRERTAATRFYSESWVLVDLLMKDPRYAEGFGRLVARCRGGEEALAAVEAEYGRTEAELMADVQRHVRRIRGERRGEAEAAEDLQVEPADPVEMELLLAELQGRVGQAAAAQPRLVAAVREDRTKPATWQGLGDNALRRGERLEARLHYEEAVKLGGRDKTMLWQLAVLEQGNPDRQAVVGVLELLVEVAPEFDDARLVLSSHYLQQRRWAEALGQLRQVKHVAPERSGYYQQAVAVAERYSGETLVALATR